jgi:hypothetical protein
VSYLIWISRDSHRSVSVITKRICIHNYALIHNIFAGLCQVKVSDNSALLLIILLLCYTNCVMCVVFGTGVVNTRYFTLRTVWSKRVLPICSADFVSISCYCDSWTIDMISHARC